VTANTIITAERLAVLLVCVVVITWWTASAVVWLREFVRVRRATLLRGSGRKSPGAQTTKAGSREVRSLAAKRDAAPAPPPGFVLVRVPYDFEAEDSLDDYWEARTLRDGLVGR
jgi:hypothetical protein